MNQGHERCRQAAQRTDSIVDGVMAYEAGEMGMEETIEFFQTMINDGIVWKMPGSYGRVASGLLDAGLCEMPQNNN